MKPRVKRVVLILCFVALVAWAALIVTMFSGMWNKSAPSGTHPTVTLEAKQETSLTPVPDTIQVWLLEKEYCTYSNDTEKKLVCQFRYDENGRCVSCSRDGQNAESLFRYDAENYLVTVIRPDYEVYTGEVRKGETLYRSDGQSLKQTEYRKTPSGEYVPCHEIVWNETGLILQNLYYDESGSVSSGSVFWYDVNSYVIKEEYMDPEQHTWAVLQYADLDSEGRVTRIYSHENAVESEAFGISMEIVYHADGTREETRYNENGEQFRKLDSDGRETYAKWYDSDSNVKKYQITEYYETEEGAVSEQKFYSLDTYVSTFIQKYNREGELVLQKRIEADGKETVLLERSYDKDGRLVYMRQNIVEIKYIYDEYGNLIKESIFGPISSGTGISVVSREYEYKQITIPRSVAEENASYFNPASTNYD